MTDPKRPSVETAPPFLKCSVPYCSGYAYTIIEGYSLCVHHSTLEGSAEAATLWMEKMEEEDEDNGRLRVPKKTPRQDFTERI